MLKRSLWPWLFVGALLSAAAVPLAAAQEVIWRHPQAEERASFEKQEGFFRPIMFAEEFARTVRLIRTPYTDSEGRAQTSLEVKMPVRALIAQTVCEANTRYFKAETPSIGLTFVAANIPQAGFTLADPDGSQSYSIPNIRIEASAVYAASDGEALEQITPLISAIRRGDVDDARNCVVFLLRTATAFLSAQRAPGQYDALVILVDEVIRVPQRMIFPPPPAAPPGPPPGGGSAPPRTPEPPGIG